MSDEIKISSRRVPGRGVLKGFKEVYETPFSKIPKIRWANEVRIENIEFFWYPYIPLRKLTMLGGDPGMGKSYISQAIAAAVSNGDPLPGQGNMSRVPQKVIMFAGEDDLSDTVAPRLLSLNATMSNIALVDAHLRLDDEGLRSIRALMLESGAKLLVLDPIVAYLGAKMDMNRANEVRPMLRGLADIMAEFSAAGLVVRHLRKQSTSGGRSKPIYNGSGSIDFTAAVRSELQVEEAKNGTRYLNHIKTNVGPLGRSITYQIIDDEFEWGEIRDMPRPSSHIEVSTRFAKEDAARVLIFDMLRDHPDGLPSNDIYMHARAMGISDRTLKKAKEGLAIAEKSNNGWLWKLLPNAKAPLTREDQEEVNG